MTSINVPFVDRALVLLLCLQITISFFPAASRIVALCSHFLYYAQWLQTFFWNRLRTTRKTVSRFLNSTKSISKTIGSPGSLNGSAAWNWTWDLWPNANCQHCWESKLTAKPRFASVAQRFRRIFWEHAAVSLGARDQWPQRHISASNCNYC